MSQPADGSVTHCLAQLRKGDPQAIELLWERYFDALVSLARQKLRATRCLCAAEDEEDLASIVFQNACEAIQQGRFPRLDDLQNLWAVLVYLTDCKLADRRKRELARKRGGCRVVLESDLQPEHPASVTPTLDQFIGNEPTPAFAAEVAEEAQLRLERLDDPTLKLIALLRLACFTNQEISDQVGCSLRSVSLKLDLIRQRWGL